MHIILLQLWLQYFYCILLHYQCQNVSATDPKSTLLNFINPFKTVISKLNKYEKAAMYAEINQKIAIRGQYNNRISPKQVPQMIDKIAYAIDYFKKYDFDRRYNYLPDDLEKQQHVKFTWFPSPPLVRLHNAVAEICWEGFLQCVLYLSTFLEKTYMSMDLEPSVMLMSLMKKKKYLPTAGTVVYYEGRSKSAQDMMNKYRRQCKEMHSRWRNNSEPFRSMFDRFSWYVTAGYFMCWYTLHDMPELKYWPRVTCSEQKYCSMVDQKLTESCALQTFCPPACCQSSTVYDPRAEFCKNTPFNPCYHDNLVIDRKCRIPSKTNRFFGSMMVNEINVSCVCPSGFAYDTYLSLCADRNECVDARAHSCDTDTQVCENLVGTFRCLCKLGYEYNHTEERCLQRDLLSGVATSDLSESDRLLETSKRYLLQEISRLNIYVRNSSRHVTRWFTHSSGTCGQTTRAISIHFLLSYIIISSVSLGSCTTSKWCTELCT